MRILLGSHISYSGSKNHEKRERSIRRNWRRSDLWHAPCLVYSLQLSLHFYLVKDHIIATFQRATRRTSTLDEWLIDRASSQCWKAWALATLIALVIVMTWRELIFTSFLVSWYQDFFSDAIRHSISCHHVCVPFYHHFTRIAKIYKVTCLQTSVHSRRRTFRRTKRLFNGGNKFTQWEKLLHAEKWIS